MSRFDATLSLTMILAILVVLGYAIVRPAPRPAPQPEGAPSEYPSPFIGSFPGRETSVSLANGIAAEAWIGAPEHAEDNGLRTSDSTAGAPRRQLAGRGGKPDTTPQPSPRLRTPVPAVGVSVTAAPTRRSVSGLSAAKAYAAARLSAAQFRCLDLLWTKESHWNPRAFYAPTGAYGIPQAVPGSKMRSAGADWRTNPITQVRWGLGYIRARYGTPCAAWAHWQRTSWY